ncbi:MAG: hypothetical protein E2O79_00260 [Caldithrix sp.]|nr:MAG: hypothetical protein E2O79_00260 [Caldithrix sp.]
MMTVKQTLYVATVLLCLTTMTVTAISGERFLGIGLTTGLGRLEGDISGSKLSPFFMGHLRFLPVPYFALNGELGFSSLNTSNSPFKTQIIPFELSAIFNFLPHSKVNPYIFAGGGGVFWKAKGIDPLTGQKGTLESNTDSFLKTGGGLEFFVSRSVAINLGATFRLSLTDNLDQLNQGDENDQVLDVHAGVTFYFNKNRNDRDNDLIPDELDLMPDIAEDHDGYLDHDGIPEKNPNPIAMGSMDWPIGNDSNASPVVIHYIVQKAESGRNISIKSHVYSEKNLKVVAILYRPMGEPKWNVVRMDERGNHLFQGEIPGYAVTTEGLEYCVVAVDETLSGIGYSGLPSKPITVNISPSGKAWRFIGATFGAATIGSASYLVLRKQK